VGQGQRSWRGIAASEGIAIGPARVLATRISIRERRIARTHVPAELERLEQAVALTESQLAHAQEQLAELEDRAGAEIAEAYRFILRDPELLERARALVSEQRQAAEWAVRQALGVTVEALAAAEDTYLRERGRDVEDVGERLLRNLLGLPEHRTGEGSAPGAVVVAAELSPLDVLHMQREGVVGLATETGGRSAHAAILARSLGLAYVAGVGGLSGEVRPGDLVVVDGLRGEVIIRAGEEALARAENQARRRRARESRLRASTGQPTETQDHVTVRLGANVERLDDIPAAIDAGAEHVGLFRTELLYLGRSDLPSEEEQYRDAVAATKALAGRPATFRTLDLAPGKLPAGVRLPNERNPALGIRSIRYSLRRPELFRAQLRALYRASAHGPIRIMFPLVSTTTEIGEVLLTCAEVRDELTRCGVPFDPRVPLGAMIETPSAALTADHICRHVDFLSIGTNDLIQYVFAADRDNDDVAYLYRPLHPAVLRLVRVVVEATSAAERELSVCGDMASDPSYALVLLGLGVRELSMSARALPAVKAALRRARLDEAKALVARALELESESEVEALVREATDGHLQGLAPPHPGSWH
jgi:phosphotransferase system enzyme I (PtsI)